MGQFTLCMEKHYIDIIFTTHFHYEYEDPTIHSIIVLKRIREVDLLEYVWLVTQESPSLSPSAQYIRRTLVEMLDSPSQNLRYRVTAFNLHALYGLNRNRCELCVYGRWPLYITEEKVPALKVPCSCTLQGTETWFVMAIPWPLYDTHAKQCLLYFVRWEGTGTLPKCTLQ